MSKILGALAMVLSLSLFGAPAVNAFSTEATVEQGDGKDKKKKHKKHGKKHHKKHKKHGKKDDQK